MKVHILKKQFLELYNSESGPIFRFCFLRVSDKDSALDITQETFIKYWMFVSRGEIIDNEKALLFKIAKNLIIDFYRKKKSFSLDEISEKEFIENSMFFASESKNDIEIKAEARHVIEQINKLEPTYRQIIYLKLVEELSPKDIAKIVDESVNVVSVRINRGMKKLREIMGNYYSKS